MLQKWKLLTWAQKLINISLVVKMMNINVKDTAKGNY